MNSYNSYQNVKSTPIITIETTLIMLPKHQKTIANRYNRFYFANNYWINNFIHRLELGLFKFVEIKIGFKDLLRIQKLKNAGMKIP